jgi:hypothetical protein
LSISICVCVLNFADDRRKFESDYQKTSPIGDAPCREVIPLVQRVEVTLGKINFLPTFWLAGLSEYPAAQKRQWFLENNFYSP